MIPSHSSHHIGMRCFCQAQWLVRMLATTARGGRAQALTLLHRHSIKMHSFRVLSTRPPGAQPPSQAPPSKTASQSTPPPTQAKGGGFTAGDLLGTALVAATVFGGGYYVMFATKDEKAAMDQRIDRAKAALGIGQKQPHKPRAPELPQPRSEAQEKALEYAERVKAALEEKAAQEQQQQQQQVQQQQKEEDDVAAATAVALAGEEGDPSAAVLVEEFAAVTSPAENEEHQQAQTEEGASQDTHDAQLAEIEAALEEHEQEVATQDHGAPHMERGEEGGQVYHHTDMDDREHRDSLVQRQQEAAARHFAGYEERARTLRLDTLERAAEATWAENEALRKHLESTLFRDLEMLSPDALRQRVVQLTVEMQERTKWEALRLHETVRKAQEEASKKYLGLIERLQHESIEELTRQARAFDAERDMALTRLEEQKDDEARRRVEAELEKQSKKFKEAFEQALTRERAQAEANTKREVENALYAEADKYKAMTEGRSEELEKLKAKVQALEGALDKSDDYQKVSWKVHKLTGALLALELKMLSGEPVSKELQALKKITTGDEVVESALAALPATIENGVPTIAELQLRFPVVKAAARAAAFVPESSPGLLGQMVGSTFAAISIQPKGLVSGSGTDEVLARAAFHVERGDLLASLEELQALDGLPGKRVHDWVTDARSRLLVEQAIHVLNTRVGLLNASLI